MQIKELNLSDGESIKIHLRNTIVEIGVLDNELGVFVESRVSNLTTTVGGCNVQGGRKVYIKGQTVYGG